MYLVFDFLKNGLSGVVSYNHLYFSPPLSNFKGGSFEPFEPPLLRAWLEVKSLEKQPKVQQKRRLQELVIMLERKGVIG